MTEPHTDKTRAEILWLDFLEAREIAFDTRRMEDATIAGRAWAAFLNEFVDEKHKSKLGSD